MHMENMVGCYVVYLKKNEHNMKILIGFVTLFFCSIVLAQKTPVGVTYDAK